MPSAVKSWHLRPHDPDAAARLAAAAKTTQVVAQLLLNRGIREPAEARLFLDTPLTALHPPQLLPGIPAAVERIIRAVKDGRRICVYGDYDVDGTTGTAILLGLFALLGAKAEFYVPNRMDEGYGLNVDAIRELAKSGVSLLITVDCGITSTAEADEARRLGLELIVTDHHEMKDRLPAADVLVHPRLPGSQYPHGDLSGAGVAFKLAWAIAQAASGSDKVAPQFRAYLMNALGLAALGLVADVVPLRDENRVFVRHGLDRLTKTPSAGIKALIAASGLAEGTVLKAEDIGFRLGPRLNAAGRLECARLAVDLLTTTNPQRARELAEYLENLNQKRQAQERRAVSEAREMVEAAGYDQHAGIVLASTEWHPGVIGIVAARIADRYGRPVLLVALKEGDEPCAGSGRSIQGFPLHEALAACAGELVAHGGHAAAAGFKVLPSRVDALRERFVAHAAGHFGGAPPQSRLVLDAEVPLAALTFGLMKELDKLEPFGAENPRPRFLAAGLKVEGVPRRIGTGERHLAFRVRQGNTLVRCVAFGMGERLDELMSAGGECCLAFTPKVNEWQGHRTVEMELMDFRPGANPDLA
ncbi:single-stranded-DNA-specific exonuclease RecJ [Fimbriiglobus ruber]|uniref:Single-stranded-DNA-specific exonuclease RecJ n=1 Tax=Fimbriiglobus ruber TaxID=1908690 RepID=A0A225EBY0_9BACT|nr:single-stranded-DNA-specific exonuclease RecJ [Fimbriiglobus ruber]OWK46839.1 Single-stranded-DNA-specific exonuclease RecJ [Fimbriiglobus ruber]